jgi:hypothetical protein
MLTQDSQKPGPTSKNALLGRVAQLARARRLQRQTGAVFLSHGDQQEQSFVQVRAKVSPVRQVAASSIEWHRLDEIPHEFSAENRSIQPPSLWRVLPQAGCYPGRMAVGGQDPVAIPGLTG